MWHATRAGMYLSHYFFKMVFNVPNSPIEEIVVVFKKGRRLRR